MRCSFRTPSHFVGFLQHWPTHYHSQLGLGVTVWHPGHLSFRVDPGILLQHAWNWFFSTSLSYSRSRYTHCCHTAACCGCASCSTGRASWLPWIWSFEDCVYNDPRKSTSHICAILQKDWSQLGLLIVVNKPQFNPVNTRCGTHHTPTHITQSIKLGHHNLPHLNP